MTSNEKEVQEALGTTPRWCIEIPLIPPAEYNVRTHVKAMDKHEALMIVQQRIRAGKWETLTEDNFDFSHTKYVLLPAEFECFEPIN